MELTVYQLCTASKSFWSNEPLSEFVWGALKLYIIFKHFNCGMVDNKRQITDEKAEKYQTKATTLWNAT